MTHAVLVAIVVVAVVCYVIGRQLLGEALRLKRVVMLPAVLALVGALDLGKDGRHPHAVDIGFIAISALVAAGIGLAQGAAMQLERRDAGLWGRMPPKGLWWWAALVVSHVLIGLLAAASGAHVAASSAPILLVLGINRLAQAGVLGARSVRAGIPFTPETGRLTAHVPTAGPPVSGAGEIPATTRTWQETGQQMLDGLGTAVRRREQRPRRSSRRSRRDRRLL